MSDRAVYFDICSRSLNHQGEELCGDQVKVLRTPTKTIVVLSDGLGSGVKANILARLTTEILVTMLRENAPLAEVVATVAGTLPTCKVRNIAYATFLILEIDHPANRFRLVNFDSPPPFLLKRGTLRQLDDHTETLGGKKLTLAEGVLERGDFLALVSDGVLYAGMEVTLNFGWGWEQIGAYLERMLQSRPDTSEAVVRSLLWKTQSLYGTNVGDDATVLGVLARDPRQLLVLTGPPADRASDTRIVTRLLDFEGRRVVCGGTTGNIVARQLDREIEMDMDTLREEVPPIGRLPGVDLLTEGILTLARGYHLLQASGPDATRLPKDRNGAVLLCQEFLQADNITFLVGETQNPHYQNPLLPPGMSIRHSLIDQLSALLRSYNKEVVIERC